MDKALHEAYAVARSYELHLTPAHHPADPDRAAEPPHTSLQPRAHTTRAVDPPGSLALRPLPVVFGSNAAAFGSYDRLCRNLCATPEWPQGLQSNEY